MRRYNSLDYDEIMNIVRHNTKLKGVNDEKQHTVGQPLHEKVWHLHKETNPRGCPSSGSVHLQSAAICETECDNQRHIHGAGSYGPGLMFTG
jgi:hypothetical protein